MTAKTWTYLIILSLLWGGSFLFGRIAVLEVPPLTVVALRVLLACLALWIFAKLIGAKFNFSKWLLVNTAIMGLINNVIPFTFILYGQTEIGSGLAAVVNAMTPIWTLLIANWLTLDEKLSPLKILAVIFGFSGVAFMMGGDIWYGLAASALAQLSVLIATISYGFAGVFGKRFKETDPIVTATMQLTMSSIMIIPLALIFESQAHLYNASFNAHASIVGLAILCTAIAYILFFKILKEAGAVNVSLVTFLIPVSAILFGVILLNETFTINHLIGMTLIALGLIANDGRIASLYKK